MKKQSGKGITRRKALQMAATGGISLSLRPTELQARSNAIIEENKKPGAGDWQLTRVCYDQSKQRSAVIEGYCSHQSIRAGERLDIMVSCQPAVPYQLDIYRTGYYGGKGARHMKKIGPLQGKPQAIPEPLDMNLYECNWEVSTSLVIPDDWLSGVYIGKLRTLPTQANIPYWESYIIFIVKDERPVDLLFQCSDNTWQAYNRWPSNYSLYTHPKGVQGPWAKVSYDRPYGRQSQYMDIVNDPLSFGSGEFLSFERPFSYFLEQEGYDVSYCSNTDLVTPERALKAKAFLSIGHDEYWDIRQYQSVQKLRAEGVNLLFFSGNSICWVSPFSANQKGVPLKRLFRGGPYGADRDYAEDRRRLFGPYPEKGPDEGHLMGVRNKRPVNGGGDWTITNSSHWIFKGTGVKNGDTIPGLIGWEFHGDAATELPNMTVVAEGVAFSGGTVPSTWQSVVYDGPKGNFVFNASTIFWAQGLSSPPGHTLPWSHYSRPHGPDERVQQITRNLLNRAIGK